jgi:hypothetical protein
MGHRKGAIWPGSVMRHPNSGRGHIDGGRSEHGSDVATVDYPGYDDLVRNFASLLAKGIP